MSNWLTKDLKDKIRKIFEPRYKRELTEEELEEIANNLTDFMQLLLSKNYKNR